MPFDHNDHYHRLLLRQVPRDAVTALDVGCGTGRFARRLAAVGLEVDALDPSEQVITAARAVSEADKVARHPSFRQADATDAELPEGHYDFISCLASLHHMPFGTVATLRDALAPGGVLVVLGCYPERSLADRVWSLAAVPVNAAARLAVAAAEKVRPAAPAGREPGAAPGVAPVKAPVARPAMPLGDIRREARVLLPGHRIHRLLFWRYLLVFRNGG
jgi:SAM-dependent methyltransferase